MADVFISYKREDRPRVKALRDTLIAEGLSVWWDVGIEGGSLWRRSIQEQLETASCVIVVWSEMSISPKAEFVHDEASFAKARNVYLPVTIDHVRAPLGFGQVQSLPLWRWNGQATDAPFLDLVAAVRAKIGDTTAAQAASPAATPAKRRTGRWEKPLLAVLPFGFPPGDSSHAYLAEGVAEDVIIGLSRTRLLRVMPGQSSLAFDGHGMNADRICAALGVQYIVQGQIRPMGQRLRVSVHLTHGATDKTVWSDRYDRTTDDLHTAEDEITTAIVSTLEPALLAHEEADAFESPDEALGAWDLFLLGRAFFWRGRRNDAMVARTYLERARALDPKDSPTLSLLAYATMHDVWLGVDNDPARAVAEAHRLALEAVTLDGSDAFAHYTFGLVLSMTSRFDEAFAEQQHALELNPCLAPASGEIGRLHAFAGRTDDAVAAADRAIRMSPNDPHIWLWLRSKALALFVAERYAEAAAEATKACVRRPDYYFLQELVAACAMAAGDTGRACAALSEARQRAPVSGRARGSLKFAHPFVNPEHFDRFTRALHAVEGVIAEAELARRGAEFDITERGP